MATILRVMPGFSPPRPPRTSTHVASPSAPSASRHAACNAPHTSRVRELQTRNKKKKRTITSPSLAHGHAAHRPSSPHSRRRPSPSCSSIPTLICAVLTNHVTPRVHALRIPTSMARSPMETEHERCGCARQPPMATTTSRS